MNEVKFPWDEFLDAQMVLMELNRAVAANEMVCPDELRAAMDRTDQCRERCVAIGELLIFLALQHPTRPLQERLTNLFGSMSSAAYERAEMARKRANHAVEVLDAVQQRTKEMQKQLDDITPGVGIPEFTAVRDGMVEQKVIEIGTRLRKVEAQLRGKAA